MATTDRIIRQLAEREYRWGFSTDIESDTVPPGLNEDVIRLISSKKNEPDWLLEWRLAAFHHWQTQTEPTWANVRFEPIDYQKIVYYSAPKKTKPGPKSLNEIDPQVRDMFNRLGISLAEQERLSGVAVDAVVDSVSVATTFQKRLAELGIIFCSFSDAVQKHPKLVRANLERSSHTRTTSSHR